MRVHLKLKRYCWPSERLATLRAGSYVEKFVRGAWRPVYLDFQVCGMTKIDGQWQEVYHGVRNETYRARLDDDKVWVFK